MLGKTRVVDDPRIDGPVPLDRGQHHLTHLGQHLLVRPAPRADEMQQRLVLGRDPFRRRNGGHRFHALALARHHQADAIIPERTNPVCMTDDTRQTLDILGKRPLDTALTLTHPSLLPPKRIPILADSQQLSTVTF